MRNVQVEKINRWYWSWFNCWVLPCIVSFKISQALETRVSGFAQMAISSSPIVLMGIYELLNKRFPGFWFGEVLRGRPALFWNASLLAFYAVILICIRIFF
jgi:hypothetical protein